MELYSGQGSEGSGAHVHKNHNHGRTIFVSGFPHSDAWGAMGLTAVVVASAIHRTYNVQTAPSMVAFHDNGEWATIDLVSHADARKVDELAEQGIMPVLRHRNRTVPPQTITVCRGGPVLVHAVNSETQATPWRQASTVIRISNLPGLNDQNWSGVRLTETVIASMIHRTYNVRTHPRDVVSLCFEGARFVFDLKIASH